MPSGATPARRARQLIPAAPTGAVFPPKTGAVFLLGIKSALAALADQARQLSDHSKVDRTHRIGQTKPVFAYRIIAKNTVEEKVLELQKTKRDLADAILNADNSVISDLKREDLEMLLS